MRLVNKTQDKEVLPRLTIAKGPLEKAIGLLNKASISLEEGMLFERCSSVHTIGMRFAIDIVFLDRSGRVLRVYGNVPGWRLVFGPWGTFYTIEAHEGAMSGIREGDVLLWEG